MEQFPRQPKNENGWVISTEFLREISDVLNRQSHEGNLSDAEPSLEQIEMVLMALEEVQS
ncbi:hypothetical protein [Paenibacillus sp. 2TAB19]|uniref:hypothetical protein n=1 Tax=Paenibacillus sp. 2TAB19 TaxID=3233003 RepID=UPI003F97C1BF